MVHTKCRGENYSTTDLKRFHLPEDELIYFEVDYKDYQPVFYEAEILEKATWAETIDPKEAKFNALDGDVDRRSFEGIYRLDKDNKPLNIKGRTGVVGRGVLGKWGPNHAADPIVTKWARTEEGDIELDATTGKPVLMFVAIKRDDTGEWAIPGGMVDPGENTTMALRREFGEEALNTDKYPERAEIIERVFNKGTLIYQGYVDDPRNTDNAWMETRAFNFHVEQADLDVLDAGSDAIAVKWTRLDSGLNMYASHAKFLKMTAESHNAHW